MLLGVDVGGTFTDAVLVEEQRGVTFTAKVPTTREQQDGVLAAVQAVLACAGVSAERVQRFAHGMTVATNALLENRGARTALVATEGFTDIVELGRQARPSLYRLCEAQPPPLAPAQLRFAAPERMGPEGPIRALDEDACGLLLERLASAEPEAVAVVLLHSYAYPQHEQRLGELIAQHIPGVHLSLSHELVGTFREYERGATTEIDAALSPLLGSYLRALGALADEHGLPSVQVMQSSGGLTDGARAASHAALTVLSGPAGGVGAALLCSEAAGEPNVLCFDMGGTSCDVCAIEAGRVSETAGRTVAGRPLALPALDIHTVGAGGGSIAWCDAGGALRVGPESAGAQPGPACYGRGGTRPTVTDANLVLGRLLAGEPLAGAVTLDVEAAERAVRLLAAELGLELLACAEGIVRVAESEMLRALSVMTVERGIDPRNFALMPFGGAGPLHAVALARELAIERVLCPRACGVLSALGLAAAAPRRDAAATVMLADATLTAERITLELARLVGRTLAELDGPLDHVGVRYELRYRGQSFELTVEEQLSADDVFGEGQRVAPLEEGSPELSAGGPYKAIGTASAEHIAIDPRDPAALGQAFEQAHEQRYGYRDERAAIELVTMRVSAIGVRPTLRLTGASAELLMPAKTRVVFDGEHVEAQLWRGELPVGTRIEGPALCALPQATLLVAPGWSGTVDDHGTVVLEQTA